MRSVELDDSILKREDITYALASHKHKMLLECSWNRHELRRSMQWLPETTPLQACLSERIVFAIRIVLSLLLHELPIASGVLEVLVLSSSTVAPMPGK